MSPDALRKIKSALERCDDTIYHDVRRMQATTPDFTYSADEVKLSEILDEAVGQVQKMLNEIRVSTNTGASDE